MSSKKYAQELKGSKISLNAHLIRCYVQKKAYLASFHGSCSFVNKVSKKMDSFTVFVFLSVVFL